MNRFWNKILRVALMAVFAQHAGAYEENPVTNGGTIDG